MRSIEGSRSPAGRVGARRLSLLIAGPLLVLVSLYLRWREISCGSSSGSAGAALISREAFRARLAPRQILASALAGGILVLLLVPSEHLSSQNYPYVSELGVVHPWGAIAAVLALRLLVVSWRGETRQSLERVVLALMVLMFVGAAFTVGFGVARDYGSWVALGAAVLLTLVALPDLAPRLTIQTVTPRAVLCGLAGAAAVASFFLPWQSACYEHSASFKALGVSGRCVSSNGLGLLGSVAAVLIIALVG